MAVASASLYSIAKRDNDLPFILMTFYDLYYKGYGFLDNLGLGYGLSVEVPSLYADSWDGLTSEQQQRLINSFYPGLEYEIKKAIDWLESGKVVLTGEKDVYDHFVYIDHRTIEDRKPTAYEVVAKGNTDNQ